MNCREFRRRYTAYRDGVDAALHADIDDHLEVCPACAAYDRAVREGVDALRGDALDLSPDFRERLFARIASGEVVPEPPPSLSPFAASAAAALLAAMVILALRESFVAPTPAAAEQPLLVAEPRVLPGIPFVAFQRKP